jgi:hypothetical protein
VAVRLRQDHPAFFAQQDRGGARRRPARWDAGILVRGPLPGLAAGNRRVADGNVRGGRGGDRRPVRLDGQA